MREKLVRSPLYNVIGKGGGRWNGLMIKVGSSNWYRQSVMKTTVITELIFPQENRKYQLQMNDAVVGMSSANYCVFRHSGKPVFFVHDGIA